MKVLIVHTNYYGIKIINVVHLYKPHVKGLFNIELSRCAILELKTCRVENIVAFKRELMRYLLLSKITIRIRH